MRAKQPQAPARKMLAITMASVRSFTPFHQTFAAESHVFSVWPTDNTEEGRDRILNNILAAMNGGTVYRLDDTTWLSGKQMVSVQKVN